MNSLNQVIIEGNVVRAPERRQTSTGKFVCTIPIAVNRNFKDASGNDVKETGYYDVEAWGESLTANISNYCFKGRGVRIVGRLKQDRWESPEGKKASKVYIVAEHVDFKPFNFKDKKNSSTTENAAAEEANLAEARSGLANEETF